MVFKQQQVLRYDSFDGGGPEYCVSIDDVSVVSCTQKREYYRDDHEELCGAGFDVVLTFTGLKEGKTSVTVIGSSPIVPTEAAVYLATVNEKLEISIEKQKSE